MKHAYVNSKVERPFRVRGNEHLFEIYEQHLGSAGAGRSQCSEEQPEGTGVMRKGRVTVTSVEEGLAMGAGNMTY